MYKKDDDEKDDGWWNDEKDVGWWKRLYPTDSVRYLGVKIDNKLNWKSHVNTIAARLNRTNTMFCKVRDFVNANVLKSYIMHYLNRTLAMLASFGDKILAQLTASTLSEKRHLELSILKSVMLTHLLRFITLKLLKL